MSAMGLWVLVVVACTGPKVSECVTTFQPELFPEKELCEGTAQLVANDAYKGGALDVKAACMKVTLPKGNDA